MATIMAMATAAPQDRRKAPPDAVVGRKLLVPRRVARAVAILLATAVLCWFSLALTVSLTIGQRSPILAERLGWTTAGTRAGVAAALLAEHSASNVARAEALAKIALRRDPTNVTAARSLGFVAAIKGDEALAERRFRYAEALSRRDAPTQLWLIESRVRANDIPGALLHYDRALRASRGARELLEPILVEASANPAIARPLAALLASRPPWWSSFTNRLVTQSHSGVALGTIVPALRLDPADEEERVMLGNSLNRMVEMGRYDLAYRLYRQARRGRDFAPSLIRDGGFESDVTVVPFEWQLVEEPGLAAVREQGGEASGGRALSFIAERGRSGEVARQLLVLRPGAYRLSALVGGVNGEGPEGPMLALRCAGSEDDLMTIRIPPTPAGPVRIARRLAIPARDCPAQWLLIRTGSNLDDETLSGWIDSLSLEPL